MFPVPLVQSSSVLTVEKFWESVLIYHNRPHLVNRKLLTVSQALFCELVINTKGINKVSDIFTRSAILYEVRNLNQLNKNSITIDFIKNIVQCYDKDVKIIDKNMHDFIVAESGVFISVRVLLPRKNVNKCVEVVILDKTNNTCTFQGAIEVEAIPLIPPFCYHIELSNSSNLRIVVESFEDADTPQAEWLSDKLFSKLIKWSENDLENKSVVPSLSLVSSDDYCLTYTNLKQKYGEDLVKRWPLKATTNAQKFVFEDIAIASYLICVWRKYCPNEKIKFVDCGCGNGLLVYILNQVGYEGYGIDLRRRPTWDLYTEDTQLLEKTVTCDSLYPDCTWIIGNHSDELTPWIPVIALKSSPKTNFFLLPCCAYDFSGQKYIRQNNSLSQYADYMNYVKEICEICNFNVNIDKLRIPSTKRTGFVGLQHKYNTNEDYLKVLNNINSFLNKKLANNDFKPRVESVISRNCTQLDRSFLLKLVNICVSHLLREENYLKRYDGENWNRGVLADLPELAELISAEDKKLLKNECGGLQTLLRNHRYIFLTEKGRVCLRKPFKLDETTKKYRTKPCWFLLNHPNGCLYNSELCAYNHSCK